MSDLVGLMVLISLLKFWPATLMYLLMRERDDRLLSRETNKNFATTAATAEARQKDRWRKNIWKNENIKCFSISMCLHFLVFVIFFLATFHDARKQNVVNKEEEVVRSILWKLLNPKEKFPNMLAKAISIWGFESLEMSGGITFLYLGFCRQDLCLSWFPPFSRVFFIHIYPFQ